MSDIGDTFTLFREELLYTPHLVGGREPVYDYTELVTSIVGGCNCNTTDTGKYRVVTGHDQIATDRGPIITADSPGNVPEEIQITGGFEIASETPEPIYNSGDDSVDELVNDDSDTDELHFSSDSDEDELHFSSDSDEDLIEFDESVNAYVRDNIDIDNFALTYSN
jgi:hypothetical protein